MKVNELMTEDGLDIERLIEASEAVIHDAAKRCRNCNYCFSTCPLFQSTRGFMSQSPSGILQSLHYALNWDLLKDREREALRDLLYLCTTCNSCVIKCKASATGVPILEAIQAGRTIIREMSIGPLPQQRKVLKDIALRGNPYGEKAEKRLEWLGDKKVKLLPRERAKAALYIGCTTAYDPDLHRQARSLVRILERLGTDFGILEEEICCGEPVLRVGDAGLFSELSARNLERIRASGVRTIVTVSPHCFHTFLHEYPLESAGVQVLHYTRMLAEMLKGGPSPFTVPFPRSVTFHDPCYLGKHNAIFDEPRELIRMVPGVTVKEMRMTKANSLCCGGGGGRMYADVEEERRLAEIRVGQAMDEGADTILTACPWCRTMMANAIKDLQLEERITVMDIAELLDRAMGEG